MVHRLSGLFILLVLVCVPVRAAEPIDIGSRLELFVDDYLIDELDGAQQVLHQPTPREVAIVHDAPWEGNICFYHTVFWDGDLYRMYHRGAHCDDKTGKVSPQVVCYAESLDGIHWKKPELGLVEHDGSKKNNIILPAGPGAHNFAPFRDANPDCKPDEQYKALGSVKGGLVAFKSADGIHWSLISEKPVITKGAFDSQNLAFWDTLRGRYVDFHRGFRDGARDIMTCTSGDFRDWTEPNWLEYTGAPRQHLYTNQITPYFRAPHIFMGFPKRFMPSRKLAEHRLPGVSDGCFMTSRDGCVFHRWAEAFVRPGLQKDRWVCRNNMIAWGIVTTKSTVAGVPDELSFYVVEGYYSGDSCQTRRYTLRVDGFVSVQAPLAGGQMVTKPIKFDGKELAVNLSTSAAGSLQVEIQDVDGKPIEGFALDDCPAIFGDEIERVVTWKGGSDVSKLAGRPVRLRFVIKDADLYSIRFR
jgi:hypothetical protein